MSYPSNKVRFERLTFVKEGLDYKLARSQEEIQLLDTYLSKVQHSISDCKRAKSYFGGIHADIEIVQRDRKRIKLAELELARVRRLEDEVDATNDDLVLEINAARYTYSSNYSEFTTLRKYLEHAQEQLKLELTTSEKLAEATLIIEDESDVFEVEQKNANRADAKALSVLEYDLNALRRQSKVARVGATKSDMLAQDEGMQQHEDTLRRKQSQFKRITILKQQISDMQDQANSASAIASRTRSQYEQLRDILDRMAERSRCGSHAALIQTFYATEDERLEQTKSIQRCGEEYKQLGTQIRRLLATIDGIKADDDSRRIEARKCVAENRRYMYQSAIMCKIAEREVRRSKQNLVDSTELLRWLMIRSRPEERELEILAQACAALGTDKLRPNDSNGYIRHYEASAAYGSLPSTPSDYHSDGVRSNSPASDAWHEGGERQIEPLAGRYSNEVSTSLAQTLITMAESSIASLLDRSAALLQNATTRYRAAELLQQSDSPGAAVDESGVLYALAHFRGGPNNRVPGFLAKRIHTDLGSRADSRSSTRLANGSSQSIDMWMSESQAFEANPGPETYRAAKRANLPRLTDSKPIAAYSVSLLYEVESLQSIGVAADAALKLSDGTSKTSAATPLSKDAIDRWLIGASQATHIRSAPKRPVEVLSEHLDGAPRVGHPVTPLRRAGTLVLTPRRPGTGGHLKNRTQRAANPEGPFASLHIHPAELNETSRRSAVNGLQCTPMRA